MSDDFIRIKVFVNIDSVLYFTSADEYYVLYTLYGYIARLSVESMYSNAMEDPKVNIDRVKNVCTFLSTRKVNVAFSGVSKYFDIDGDIVRIKHWDWIEFRAEKTARKSIPKKVKEISNNRIGRRCAYCGDTDGPFEYDHLFPVSKGGTNDSSNVVLACKPCNRSKSDKTLRQWVEGGAL